jgi:hypothetical protein
LITWITSRAFSTSERKYASLSRSVRTPWAGGRKV